MLLNGFPFQYQQVRKYEGGNIKEILYMLNEMYDLKPSEMDNNSALILYFIM
jgi:hypothetical protein